MVANDTTPPPAADLLKLEKAHIDLGSVKIQMVLGALIILIACLTAAWRHVAGDLMSEVDAHVLEETSRRLTTLEFADPAQPQPFAYPVSPVWFLSNMFLLAAGIQGCRTINTGIVALTCLLVALITLEITGRYGNRLGAVPAIWAGLLFAVHPLHARAQNMLASSGLLLAAMLYLAAFWTYMRFRLLREQPYLASSIVLCFLAFLTDFRSLTLLPAMFLAEWCLYRKPDDGARQTILNSVKAISPYAVPVAFFGLLAAVVPSFFPYAHITLTPEPLAYLWRAIPLLLPFEFSAGAMTWSSQVLMLLYLACLSMLVVRIGLRSVRPAPLIFGSALAFLLASPVILTWNIAYPLQAQNAPLYLATGPVCILLALTALPAVDAASKRHVRWLSLSGAAALGAVFAIWSGLFLAEVYQLL